MAAGDFPPDLMKLAVNLRLYVKGEIGGIENYLRRVLSGIAAHQSHGGEDWCVFAHATQVSNVAEFTPGARIIPVVHETGTEAIASELRRGSYDALFCPLLVLDPLRPHIPAAVTIPDLQHEFFPEFFDPSTLQWRYATFRPSALHADVVFTISEFSKKTLIERFQVLPGNIVVTPLAADDDLEAPATPEATAKFQALALFEEYLYYPANFWQHKNHTGLLQALKILVENGYPQLGLVLTGAPSTGAERVADAARALGLSANLRIVGYQDRAVVAEIYRHARAVAFVSRFEGFGLPILEAFAMRTPVVASRACSCPEVAGDAAILVDPTDAGDIAAGLRRVLEDSGLRDSLIAKGAMRVRSYSWERVVEQTLAGLERIASRPRSACVEVSEYPTVSIVTPTYNMARYLGETIESVLSQEYPHIEYLVMDGGSNDGTVELLRKYEGRLRYHSGPDEGQADAVNHGFAKTSGPIFAFLNADDTYLSNAVGIAVNNLLQHKEAGVVYGEAYYVREDGSIIDRYPTLPFDFALLNRNCFICQPAAFMRRDAFSAAGGLNKTLHIALDYDLWIRIAKLYPFRKIDDYLATSRMYPENKTLRRRRQVYEEILRVAMAHYGYIPYDWIYGYVSHLLEGKDQFFAAEKPTLGKYALSLGLGCVYNYRQMRRYVRDWCTVTGAAGHFQSRWADGWISKVFVEDFAIGERCDRIQIAGRHLAPISGGLALTVRLNEKSVTRTELLTHGPFRIEVECPPELRGRHCRLGIEANKTFRPLTGGDIRKLSCIIDSINFAAVIRK